MFKFKGHFEKLSLDKSAWTKKLNEELDVQMRQAMRAFLRAAITKVPSYTGMARGSLQPIGRLLGVAIPITKSPRAKYYPDKTPEAGAALTTFEFKGKDGKQSVIVKIGTLHYLINDFYKVIDFPLIHPTPWGSIDAGRTAFKEYLRENLKKRIPRIKDFVTRTRVTFG